jgi:hypothetical protein
VVPLASWSIWMSTGGHWRFILLDNVTGYRSQYQQKSFLLEIE